MLLFSFSTNSLPRHLRLLHVLLLFFLLSSYSSSISSSSSPFSSSSSSSPHNFREPISFTQEVIFFFRFISTLFAFLFLLCPFLPLPPCRYFFLLLPFFLVPLLILTVAFLLFLFLLLFLPSFLGLCCDSQGCDCPPMVV